MGITDHARRNLVRRAGRTSILLLASVALIAGLAPARAVAEDPSWNIVDSANTSPDESNRLQDVDCTEAGECMAVGFTSGCLEADTGLPLPVGGAGVCNLHRTLIEQWDGTTWSIVETPSPSPTANQLWGVECVSPNDCWAVGNYTGAGGAWTLILRWDGSGWNIVPSPNPTSPFLDGKLRSITCVAPDDCWAVGHGSNYITSDTIPRENPLALHWDGIAWTIVPVPNRNPDHSHWLQDVTCVEAQDCRAVGYSVDEGDTYETLAMQWDGTSWSIIDSPNPSPTPRRLTGDRLRAVTCTTPSDCWAVGDAGGDFDNVPLVMRWDGSTWSVVPTPSGRGTLEDVSCAIADRCWAVGGSAPFVGVRLMRWDGEGWRIAPSPGNADTLNGITCTDECWAVGHHRPGFAPGPRANLWQTLTLSTIAVERGDGEHIRVDPSGDESWVARYDGPMGRLDAAAAAGVSPDGALVFVTGESLGPDQREDFATVAYDAGDGSPRWLARYAGPTGYGVDRPVALAVSPDGSRVFVTGLSTALFGDRDTGWDFATVAYDAGDGSELWTARYNGPADGDDTARSLALSPDGSRVYVTGGSAGGNTTGRDFATVAYDATDGRELWVGRYDGPANGSDSSQDVGAGPDGVFVTGFSPGVGTGIFDFATVAYDPVDGGEQWVSRYNGPANGYEGGRAVAVSPDGARVYVAGESIGGTNPTAFEARDYATVAYDTATGRELWVGRYDGPAHNTDLPETLRVSPDGAGVYITGESTGADELGQPTEWDYATVAYDALTGSERWAARYDGPFGGIDLADALGISPDGSSLFVSGMSDGENTGRDFATIEYDTSDGTELWVARHNGSGTGNDDANALAVAPDGSSLFVAGRSQVEDRGLPGHEDFTTIAYETGVDPSPSPSPTATGSPSPSPSPTETPLPENTEVSFTEDSAASGQYSDEVSLKARLADSEGDPIEGAPLTFTLTGEGAARSFEATTGSDGVAEATPTLEEKPGAHQLTVRYEGDEQRASSADTMAFAIEKEDTDTELTVEGRGGNMTLRARLTDLDSPADGIAGRTITFYSDEQEIGSAETGSDGRAEEPVPPGHRGANRTYEAVFSGDDFYLPSTGERDGQGTGQGTGASI